MFILAIASPNYAQEDYLSRLTQKDHPTFFEIQEAANNFYQGMNTAHKPGFKQYKRWEWFAQYRLNQQGYLDPALQYQGWLEKESRFGTREGSANTGADWKFIGPTSVTGTGLGRLNCIAFDPHDTTIIWVGSPTGGLWKSTNAGQTWSTTTDELPNLGVSDIVIHPYNSQIMYIATGDKQRGSTLSYGILKSTNGGQSWQFTGLNPHLEDKYKIGKLLMHPDNPDTLLCATSHGIYKTTTSSTSWQLKQEGDFFDMEIHPTHSATWYASRSKYGVYRSTDAGETWTRLMNGLPNPGADVGRIALAVSPSVAGTIYALYSQDVVSQGWLWGLYGVYRSTDNGDSWNRQVGVSPNILGWEFAGTDTGGQGGYALVLEVNPQNPNILIAGSVHLWKSFNGGVSWQITAYSETRGNVAYVHPDHHEIAYLPGSSNTLFSCHDGGLDRSDDDGHTWTDISRGLGIQEIYRLALTPRDPDQVVVGAQDNGSELLRGTWRAVSGGDGMGCLVDPNNANIIFTSWQFGNVLLSMDGGLSTIQVFNAVVDECTWVAPLAMDPVNSATVYLASTRVNKSTDRGLTATAISPTFTGQPLTIMKIAPSDARVIVVSDGHRLFKTADGGTTWNELDSASFPTYITDIAIHPTNPDILWLTMGGYGRWNNLYIWLNVPYPVDKPKVFYSTNSGLLWTDVSGLLPNIPANCITVDPFSLGVYLGTDLGVFYSSSGTGDWVRFDFGLPNVIITQMAIQPAMGRILATTYGRGLWASPLATQPNVFPPLYFTGQIQINRTFLQIERIHDLSWAANPKNTGTTNTSKIVAYRLYRVTGETHTLIAELAANVFTYRQRQMGTGSYRYALTALDEWGRESAPLFMMF